MATKKKLLQAAAGSAGGGILNVEDVFSTDLWYGTGSSTNTITNNIDISGEGGLVWVKTRSRTGEQHIFTDTVNGQGKALNSATTSTLSTTTESVQNLNSDGYSFSGDLSPINRPGDTYAGWTFRKAPGFFDVVKYTGNGSSQNISHSLGSVPGMIFIKALDAAHNWCVWHKSPSHPNYGILNGTFGCKFQAYDGFFGSSLSHTSTTFYVGGSTRNENSTFGGSATGTTSVNENGTEYIAYIFAHNDGDGTFGATEDQDIIKCGSYIANETSPPEIDLGFEPQWIIIKQISDNYNEWVVFDNMRGVGTQGIAGAGKDAMIRANTTSHAEYDAANQIEFTSTGFKLTTAGLGVTNAPSGEVYVYMAIRRPMKVPENASEVFHVQEIAGNGSSRIITTGTRVDFVMSKANDITYGWRGTDRVRGSGFPFLMDSNSSESNNYTTGHWLDSTDGFEIISGSNPYNASGYQYNHWAWTRAPNFFDIVAWEGTGAYTTTINHNLGVTPEMIWVKNRDVSEDWAVYHKAIGTYYGPTGTTGGVLRLDANSGVSDTGINSTTYWRDQEPDADAFYLGSQGRVNGSGYDYAAYLFASLDGVSKVGSYTGTGSDQTIDCGFSNGASFVLVKRYDVGSQSWHIWDSARGITTGNDSTHFLDLSQQENTSSNYIDPHSSGFTLKSNFTATNASGGSYIFYAIAAI